MSHLKPDYYETRPNLITAGLRLVATSEITADLTLVVQHKKVTPFEGNVDCSIFTTLICFRKYRFASFQ